MLTQDSPAILPFDLKSVFWFGKYLKACSTSTDKKDLTSSANEYPTSSKLKQVTLIVNTLPLLYTRDPEEFWKFANIFDIERRKNADALPVEPEFKINVLQD